MRSTIVTCSASSITGINNFGDELLTRLYGNWISSYAESCSAAHLEVDGHGVLSPEARGAIDSARGLFFTGGGYFADGDHLSRYALRRHLRAIRNRRVYWTVFRRARSGGIPCAVFGLEVGPLANPPYRRAVRRILRAARKVVVRNAESMAYARKLCGDDLEISVRLDAALSGAADTTGAEVPIEKAAGDFCIGVHIHNLEAGIAGEETVRLLRRVVDLVPADRRVRLFYFHDQRKQGHHPPRSVRAELHFASAFPGLTSVPYRSPAETTLAVTEMDLVVTSKLHLGIVARSRDVPVLAIGAHPKIRRFYETIGEGYACASASELLGGDLPDPLVAVLEGAMDRIPLGQEHRDSAFANRTEVWQVLDGLL